MKKHQIVLPLLALVIVVGSFYGGTVYGKTHSGQNRGLFAGGQFGAQMGGMRTARAGAGFSSGEIISKDATSMTIKLATGSTQIVLLSTSTPVTKSIAGNLSDLSVETPVMVSGTTNSDGSITAQSIQIRPTGVQLPQGARATQ